MAFYSSGIFYHSAEAAVRPIVVDADWLEAIQEYRRGQRL